MSYHWTELAWYSPSATHQISLYGLEHNFRPTWPCLKMKLPANQETCDHLYLTNIFDRFCGIRVQFEQVKHEVPNQTMLHLVSAAFKSHVHTQLCNVQCVSASTNMILPVTMDIMPWFQLLWSHDIPTAN